VTQLRNGRAGAGLRSIVHHRLEPMNQPTNADLMDELRRLREEVQRLREKVEPAADELVRVHEFADRKGLGRSTVYEKAERQGIPIRGAHGYPKEDGDRSAAYISLTEWEAAERLDTRTVRRNAGFYD
jgi:hypothetical protein